MNPRHAVILSLVVLMFALSLTVYPRMPDMMAVHWGLDSVVNGYMSRFWGLFLIPFLCVFIVLLLLFIPRIDPLKKNIMKFIFHYEVFIIVFLSFMFYTHLIMVFWNFGVQFNIGQVLSPAFAVLLYYLGVLMKNARQNWFIGIRTPWTLSNEVVWRRTHERGSSLFRSISFIAVLGVFFPSLAFFFILLPVLSVVFYLWVYSYFEFKKLKALPKK